MCDTTSGGSCERRCIVGLEIDAFEEQCRSQDTSVWQGNESKEGDKGSEVNQSPWQTDVSRLGGTFSFKLSRGNFDFIKEADSSPVVLGRLNPKVDMCSLHVLSDR